MATILTDSFEEMTVDELYARLKPIARKLMRGEQPDHTFGQATVLIDEFFLRMKRYFPELEQSAETRRTVAKQATRTMVRILIDHHKFHHRQKRTGDRERVDLQLVDGAGRISRRPVDLVALNDALEELGKSDATAAEIVQRKFFGGMTVAEIASDLGITESEVEAGWARAKAWLARKLG